MLGMVPNRERQILLSAHAAEWKTDTQITTDDACKGAAKKRSKLVVRFDDTAQ